MLQRKSGSAFGIMLFIDSDDKKMYALIVQPPPPPNFFYSFIQRSINYSMGPQSNHLVFTTATYAFPICTPVDSVDLVLMSWQINR